ncbi:hypothetical protein [Cupriavidus sp. UYPR2.512]|uniref:hypothetical protein n=1 Tax=Cupriavidus sp. UYPR2.512 TaxID=1080187 RepID=UPI001E423B09|nr:hypothetical protein [Cupriavidus sp. UYPR2.512]
MALNCPDMCTRLLRVIRARPYFEELRGIQSGLTWCQAAERRRHGEERIMRYGLGAALCTAVLAGCVAYPYAGDSYYPAYPAYPVSSAYYYGSYPVAPAYYPYYGPWPGYGGFYGSFTYIHGGGGYGGHHWHGGGGHGQGGWHRGGRGR